jgi:hypothetical protein
LCGRASVFWPLLANPPLRPFSWWSTGWDAAANSYAEDHDRYFTIMREIGQWTFYLFLAQGEAYDRLRERAFPLLATEPDRMPDAWN